MDGRDDQALSYAHQHTGSHNGVRAFGVRWGEDGGGGPQRKRHGQRFLAPPPLGGPPPRHLRQRCVYRDLDFAIGCDFIST